MVEAVRSRICSTFGIRLPLLMGAITPQPQLGAVVSIAGGLGCIEGISSPDKLRQQIREFRRLTDVPSVAHVFRELFEAGPQRAREVADALETLAKDFHQR